MCDIDIGLVQSCKFAFRHGLDQIIMYVCVCVCVWCVCVCVCVCV